MTEVPAAARDAVLARAARLSLQARELLDVAALIGTRIEPQLIEATSPGSAALVDEILASGLIVGGRSAAEVPPRDRPAGGGAGHPGAPARRHSCPHPGGAEAAACEDDARMAFHAEGASDGEAVLRYATSAAAAGGGPGLTPEAAAQFERALALRRRHGSGDGGRPCSTSGLRGFAHRPVAGCRRCPRARPGTVAGRPVTRSAKGTRCAGFPAPCGGYAAAPTRSPRPNSRWRRWSRSGPVPNWPGHRQPGHPADADGEHSAAIGLARRAQAIAETSGCFRGAQRRAQHRGLRRSPRRTRTGPASCARRCRSRSPRLQEQAGRAYANLHSLYSALRRFAEPSVFTDGIAYCDEHDITTYSNCLRGERTELPGDDRTLGRGRGAERCATEQCRPHRSTGSIRSSASA